MCVYACEREYVCLCVRVRVSVGVCALCACGFGVRPGLGLGSLRSYLFTVLAKHYLLSRVGSGEPCGFYGGGGRWGTL